MADYNQTINYLFSRLPMFSRIGAAAYKADLTNTIELCKALGNPQNSFKCIHIAGTNGKGSVSHSIAAILQQSGYKTGLYTSPHLRDFRERIRVNGKMVEESFVIDFTEKIKPEIEKLQPSFFEITVAMAFEYFSSKKVDVAVIETGLGGRLDSTNIITPILSVITNIGYDHMNLLGDTLPKIAYEKAGIIKPKIPVVIGEIIPETLKVFMQKAQQENAPIYIAEQLRKATHWELKNNRLNVVVTNTSEANTTDYELELTGLYQIKNLLTILESVTQLQKLGFILNNADVRQALQNVSLLTGFEGRWQVIHHQPYTVLDVAHNKDGIAQILHQVETLQYHKLHIVIGMVKDKDVDTILSMLPKHAIYYFTKAQIERAMLQQELQQKALLHQLKGETYSTAMQALQTAVFHAAKQDMILVCGSVFVIGEIDQSAIIW